MRDKAYEIITEIHKEPDIYDSSKRRQLILSASEKFNTSEKTIYKYLKRYWKGGKNKNALIPEFKNCGGRGKEKSSNRIKRGRPRRYISDNKAGINVDDKIKKIFKISLEKYYYNNKQNSLTTAYELMKKEFFTEEYKIKNGIKVPILKDINEIPTIGQFRYWFEKERNIKNEVSKRKSSKNFNLNNRALLGDSTAEIAGPGSLYQIDATVVDVYLVSRYKREWIIGRPILYVVMDTFSRMVTGIYIGLEGPSWSGAMMALANSAMSKVEFCREYGIEITEEEWPVHYIPDAIVADRGEFEGKVSEGLVEGLHVKIQNTSSFRGDMKAIVERYFNTIHTKIKPFVPGYINYDFRQRGGRDYRLDAKLDIYQFTKIIIKCVLYHNNQHFLSNYNRTDLMINDGIQPIPIHLWNWGIKNISGRLRFFPEDIVKLNLMPTDKAIVTAKGIKFKNMYYSSKRALKERWFERARTYGSWNVKICYDARNMNYIYIKDEDDRGFEKCFLLEHQARYKDRTLEEIVYLNHVEKLDKKINEEENSQEKIDLITEIEEIVKEAEGMSGNFNKDSNTKKVRGIRKNRNMEKFINRNNESFILEKDELIEDEKVEVNKSKDKMGTNLFNIDLFKKKQKERFNGQK